MPSKNWEQIRAARAAADPGFDEGYEHARVNFELAQLVYDLRTGAGLTQTELARRMATKQPHVARLEGGSISPTIDLLRRLGDALGVRLVLRAEGVATSDAMEVRFSGPTPDRADEVSTFKSHVPSILRRRQYERPVVPDASRSHLPNALARPCSVATSGSGPSPTPASNRTA